eukprot:TRINITY_DN2281_c0_g1_i2.p1 TRINITY_DN2281_c0_g1~~TRINITY_DN2281_c0_g1_i2.p1  ORF type:complete len:157 (-),score=9.13 TRINITY_DN2281_c0_g1_i2:98-568(-)
MAISQRGGKSLKMNVRVLSEEVVRPRAPAPDHPKLLELCVIDQVQPRFHGPPMLAFLGPMPDELPFEEFVQRSKEAWARTLVAYYTLAGRLVTRISRRGTSGSSSRLGRYGITLFNRGLPIISFTSIGTGNRGATPSTSCVLLATGWPDACDRGNE